MVRFIKEHLEDSLSILVKVDMRTDLARLLIELGIVCCTHCLEEPLVMIVSFSLSTLP